VHLAKPETPMSDPIDCAKCGKPFRGNAAAERIRCPHCQHVNLLNVPPLDPWVIPTLPRYSQDEALATAQKIMSENTLADPWEPVDVKYEFVKEISTRCYCIGDNGNEVWVGVARSEDFPGNIKQCFDIFWNLQEELKWNTTTLKQTQLIEEQGDTQVVYQERKVHSSLSFGADVVYARTYKAFETHCLAWGASCQHPKKGKQGTLRRCDIVFFGFQVVPGATPGTISITLTSAFNELGNIPKLVIIDELKKISLRVCKIAKRVMRRTQ